MISEPLVLLIVGIYFVLFLMLGQNVAAVLLGTGTVGIILWTGPETIIPFFEADVFYRVATYSFVTIPLYILMAFFLMRGGVMKDLYYFIHIVGGKRRSPLGMTTILMGGFLGAVSGSATAISAGLAVLASPELRRYGYTKNFSVSLAAVGGSLSAIIPPSIIIIIYASISELSIGKLFMGAMIPGILMTLTFALSILVFERLWPSKVLSEVSSEENKGLTSLDESEYNIRSSAISLLIIIALILIVFGGIYGGVMTATEAGGVAAFLAMVAMMVRRKLTFASTFGALIDTARMSAMIMAIVIGAQIFGRFMSLSMIPRKLIALLEPLSGHPYVIVLMLLIVLFVMGMILESAAVMVMIIPITDPIIRALGVDPIWFGVMASAVIVLGLLTPPVGLAVYSAATAAKEPVGGVFRHTMIFALFSAILVVPWLFVFPQLVTFLPNTMLK